MPTNNSPFKIKTCLARHHPKPEWWLQTSLNYPIPGLGDPKSAPHAPQSSGCFRHIPINPQDPPQTPTMAGKNGRLHYVALSDAAKRREARCFRFEQLIKLTIPCATGMWDGQQAYMHMSLTSIPYTNSRFHVERLPITVFVRVSAGMHPCEDLAFDMPAW